jgi:hypothetical protein
MCFCGLAPVTSVKPSTCQARVAFCSWPPPTTRSCKLVKKSRTEEAEQARAALTWLKAMSGHHL